MSIERNPNINIAGLAVDIIQATLARVRGEAATLPHEEIIGILDGPMQQFCVELSTLLDVYVDHQTKKPPTG